MNEEKIPSETKTWLENIWSPGLNKKLNIITTGISTYNLR